MIFDQLKSISLQQKSLSLNWAHHNGSMLDVWKYLSPLRTDVFSSFVVDVGLLRCS